MQYCQNKDEFSRKIKGDYKHKFRSYVPLEFALVLEMQKQNSVFWQNASPRLKYNSSAKSYLILEFTEIASLLFLFRYSQIIPASLITLKHAISKMDKFDTQHPSGRDSIIIDRAVRI